MPRAAAFALAPTDDPGPPPPFSRLLGPAALPPVGLRAAGPSHRLRPPRPHQMQTAAPTGEAAAMGRRCLDLALITPPPCLAIPRVAQVRVDHGGGDCCIRPSQCQGQQCPHPRPAGRGCSDNASSAHCCPQLKCRRFSSPLPCGSSPAGRGRGSHCHVAPSALAWMTCGALPSPPGVGPWALEDWGAGFPHHTPLHHPPLFSFFLSLFALSLLLPLYISLSLHASQPPDPVPPFTLTPIPAPSLLLPSEADPRPARGSSTAPSTLGKTPPL